MGTSSTMVSDETNASEDEAMSHCRHISTEGRKSIAEPYCAGKASTPMSLATGCSSKITRLTKSEFEEWFHQAADLPDTALKRYAQAGNGERKQRIAQKLPGH